MLSKCGSNLFFLLKKLVSESTAGSRVRSPYQQSSTTVLAISPEITAVICQPMEPAAEQQHPARGTATRPRPLRSSVVRPGSPLRPPVRPPCPSSSSPPRCAPRRSGPPPRVRRPARPAAHQSPGSNMAGPGTATERIGAGAEPPVTGVRTSQR